MAFSLSLPLLLGFKDARAYTAQIYEELNFAKIINKNDAPELKNNGKKVYA